MDSSEYGRIKNLLQSTCSSLDVAPIPNLPNISGGTTVVTNPPTTSTNSPVTPNTAPTGTTGQITPGAYCSQEGAIGYFTKKGNQVATTYVCSKTSASGALYEDGRLHWRAA
jgi:hypothetical protein